MYWINENIVWVKGYCKSAIYDFLSGKVYWADEKLTCVIEDYIKERNECKIIRDLMEEGMIDSNFIKKYEVNNFIDRYRKMAWLELTQQCNLRCVHCYAGDIHKSSKSSMSLTEWKKVIDELIDNNFSTIILIGGEPTLYPNIKELIEYIYSKNIRIVLFSNITTLDDETIEFIAQKNVVVHFSIYSSKCEEHDNITQVKGSYKKMITSLKKLLDFGVKVEPAVTIMKENSIAAQGIIDLLKDFSIDLKKIDCIRPMDGGDQLAHMPSDEVIRSFEMHYPNFKANKDFFYKSIFGNTCLYGKFAISETGEVYPCEFIRNISFGNVKSKSIKDIIEDLKKEVWSITSYDIEDCKNCEFRHCCKDCRHLSITKPYRKKYRCFYNPITGSFE